MSISARAHDLIMATAGGAFGDLLLMSLDALHPSIPGHSVLKFGNGRLGSKKRDSDDCRGIDQPSKRQKYGSAGEWSGGDWGGRLSCRKKDPVKAKKTATKLIKEQKIPLYDASYFARK